MLKLLPKPSDHVVVVSYEELQELEGAGKEVRKGARKGVPGAPGRGVLGGC